MCKRKIRGDLWLPTSRLSEQTCGLWGHAEGWSPAQRCSVPWCGPVGWLASPMQAVAAKNGGHAPFLLDIRLQTPSTVIKVEFPWLVLSCLCWGNTLSSEQKKTRAGRDELGCGCSLGKPGYFPGRLKPPLSLISKNARSGLAQQKEDRGHSSWSFQHHSRESGLFAASLCYRKVFCADVLPGCPVLWSRGAAAPVCNWEHPIRDAGLYGHTCGVEAALEHAQNRSAVL